MAVSLREEKSFFRVIQLPKVKIADIGKAIRWEIEANIPLPFEELVYDYEVVDSFDEHLDHVDVVISAFPKTIVDAYVRVLGAAGLRLACLELESQAIVRSVNSPFSDSFSKWVGKTSSHTINSTEKIKLNNKDVIKQMEDSDTVSYYAECYDDAYCKAYYLGTDKQKSVIEQMIQTLIFKPTALQISGAKIIP